MAHVDKSTGRLTLHVVYDGAPRSGKTTSVRALAQRRGQQVETPEERHGRTVFFDWLDYAGGLFEGKPIQCRIIAVPGQPEFAFRRETILEAADAVIFVVDSSAERFPNSRAHFAELEAFLAKRERSIPILAQLNKRDVIDAIPITEARAAFADSAAVIGESVAKLDDGVQSTFALAVGEAMRALRDSGGLGGIHRNWGAGQDLGNPWSLLERLVTLEKPNQPLEEKP